MTTRRDFIQLASTAVFVGGQLQRVPRGATTRCDRYPRAGDPRLKELAARALDAATAVGATYADVRFTLTEQEGLWCGPMPGAGDDWSHHRTRNQGGVGVRALVNGVWGFVSSTTWTPEELARLGHEAAVQGKTYGRGRRQKIEWIARPAVTGTWVMPVRIDPFTVPLAEKIDVGLAWIGRCSGRFNMQYGYGATSGFMGWHIQRQETTFASTEGSFLTQTRYVTRPLVSASYVTGTRGFRFLDRLQPCAKGWEIMTDPTLYDEIPRLLEEAQLYGQRETPDPGRYDIVCDSTVVAQLLAHTIGVATELDRVLGYESNAGGTSYLAPPEEKLGSFALGPASLNVTANRSTPGLAGTTRWDDEGVEPDAYPVIRDGIVVGYHTNRDLASTLAVWDATQGRPVHSHGCAVAASGQDLPLIQPPNLVMAPAATDTTFEELVAGLEHGIVFAGGRPPWNEAADLERMDPTMEPTNNVSTPYRYPGSVTVDRQQLNGELSASFIYEVRRGKRVRTLGNVEALFRATDLWKNLQASGGVSTQMDAGYFATKGEPTQDAAFGVRARRGSSRSPSPTA